MSIETDSALAASNGQSSMSLGTAAARNLTTTTKSLPQMQEISSRWLLRMLPWVQVAGGTYRVNRRLSYAVGCGRVSFVKTGSDVRVIPPSLRELPPLRTVGDPALLGELAERFTQREFDGVKAVTACTLLALPRQEIQALTGQSQALRAHIQSYQAATRKPQNKHGEAHIAMAAGHAGEPELPGTFVDYEATPREYELSVAQTVLRVHTRVADLYNEPMSQVEQQLRLTIEALRERQEHEMINNKEFGLLPNADYDQRIHAHHGPPTPDDLDELLARRRNSRFFLAHPRTIAAFGRECNRRGIYPATAEVQGHMVPAWRGVPVLPCNKIPISGEHTSSILVLRTGEDDQGVIGLHQTGIPDEYQPSLSVRFMGISEKAIISYLVSAYYSVAVLVPDALGVLENVEVARPSD